MSKIEAHSHYAVASMARELCLVTYENIMSNNAIRAEWKRRHPGAREKGLIKAFLRVYLGAHLGPARATMAQMLADPRYDDATKLAIHEALVLDATLKRGRQ